MRRIALILAVIACGGVAAYSAFVGWSEEPRASIPLPPRSARTAEPRSERLEPPEMPEVATPTDAPRIAAVPPGATLEIRVVDESGGAAKDVPVRVLDALTLSPRFRDSARPTAVPEVIATDAEGIARWEDLEPGEHWCWSAQSPTLRFEPEPGPSLRGWSKTFSLRAGETTRLAGRVVSTLSVVGRVIGADARPLPRLFVQARRRDLRRSQEFRSTKTDVDGRFVLDRLPLEPLEILASGTDAPDSLTFVRLAVDPVAAVRMDVGTLMPSARLLEVRLRAIDSAGVDVTEPATPGTTMPLAIDVRSSSVIEHRLQVPLDGAFRLIGFDDRDLALRIGKEPEPSSCGSGWAILWDDAWTGVPFRVGEFPFDVRVFRAELVDFAAAAIESDEKRVARLGVSLAPEQGGAAIEFEMHALPGKPFAGERVVPVGSYRLRAKCEDGRGVWTADQPILVDADSRGPFRIDLVRVH